MFTLTEEAKKAAKERARELPALPDGHAHGDGYGWMGALGNGWGEVASWGRDGWDLGSWPYVVVAHLDDDKRGLYGTALYVEGDLFVEAWETRRERDLSTSATAVWYWRYYGRGPKDLPSEGPAPYYGRYVG